MTRRVICCAVCSLIAAGCADLHSVRVVSGRAGAGVSGSLVQGSPAVREATAAQLMSGHWSALPAAPIAPHYDADVVWSGNELLVWGGQGFRTEKPLGTGAAFDPRTRTWRVLPTGPLGGRDGAAAVWTGTGMFVWGGYTSESPQTYRVSNTGAVYLPASNSWRRLPAAPLSARARPLVVWTGHAVILLGGDPAVSSGQQSTYADGAAYDPATESWRHIPPPAAPKGGRIWWVAAVQAGSELLAWSEWSIRHRISKNTYTGRGGIDLFAYNEQSGRWRLLRSRPNELPAVDTTLWTGRAVLVRGAPYNCGPCIGGPFAPDASALFNPTTNTWHPLPPDPLGSNEQLSTWTGAALVSFDAGGIFGQVRPGDATTYDPAARRWHRLPPAPFGCDSSSAPIWTGKQLLMYCPRPTRGKASHHDGLAFTLR